MDERNTMSFMPLKTNENGSIVYNLRVVPYFDLNSKERKTISCEPRYLCYQEDGWHVSEIPALHHDPEIKLNTRLVYIYDEMNAEEMALYADRFTTMEICASEVESVKNLAAREKSFNGKSLKKGKYLKPRNGIND